MEKGVEKEFEKDTIFFTSQLCNCCSKPGSYFLFQVLGKDRLNTLLQIWEFPLLIWGIANQRLSCFQLIFCLSNHIAWLQEGNSIIWSNCDFGKVHAEIQVDTLKDDLLEK